MQKDKSSSGKHPDSIPAQATLHERQQAMKHQVKKFKSPKLSDKYSISIPYLRITYYIKTAKRYKAQIEALAKAHPDYELICKLPDKQR